tara:strand:+ start:14589 stop:15110 length:522 start_codon:yes stop_codon:yes gene_type:complete
MGYPEQVFSRGWLSGSGPLSVGTYGHLSLVVAEDAGRLNPALVEARRKLAEKNRLEILPPLKSRPDIPIALLQLDRRQTIAEISSLLQTRADNDEVVNKAPSAEQVRESVEAFLADPLETPKLEIFDPRTLIPDPSKGIILPTQAELAELLEKQDQQNLEAILLLICLALDDD